ncbi:MAG: hypothetical protein Q4P66_01095 [Actinomycetaceae bacterium]|nr:hypothetical protein [Actinomycetaceae bacterium]
MKQSLSASFGWFVATVTAVAMLGGSIMPASAANTEPDQLVGQSAADTIHTDVAAGKAPDNFAHSYSVQPNSITASASAGSETFTTHPTASITKDAAEGSILPVRPTDTNLLDKTQPDSASASTPFSSEDEANDEVFDTAEASNDTSDTPSTHTGENESETTSTIQGEGENVAKAHTDDNNTVSKPSAAHGSLPLVDKVTEAPMSKPNKTSKPSYLHTSDLLTDTSASLESESASELQETPDASTEPLPVEPGFDTPLNRDDSEEVTAEDSTVGNNENSGEETGEGSDEEGDIPGVEETPPPTSVEDSDEVTSDLPPPSSSSPLYSEAPVVAETTSDDFDNELPLHTVVTREPPIVGPPPDEFLLPPLPTREEWEKGRKYLQDECLEYYGINKPGVVDKMLAGDPEYDVFPFAFSCFNHAKWSPSVYPSFHRGSAEHPATPAPSEPSAQPDKPVNKPTPTPTVPLPTSPNPTGESGSNDTPASTPSADDADTPGHTNPADPEEPDGTPHTHDGTSDSEITDARPSVETDMTQSTSDKPQGTPRPDWSNFDSPLIIRDGQRYIRPWKPRQHTPQPLALGRAIDVMSSSTFADPYKTRTNLSRLAPAGPDAMELDDYLVLLGVTSQDIPWSGNGTATAIDGDSDGTGAGKILTYQVQLEGLMPVDPPVFASHFQGILDQDTRYRYQRRSHGRTDLTFVVASPSMTYQLCTPEADPIDTPDANTPEPASCVTDDKKIVINLRKWAFGDEQNDTAHNTAPREDNDKQADKYHKEFLKKSIDDVLD